MKNIRFVISGREVEMGNSSMSFQLKNPMFEDVGSHSLPVQIPRTRNNENIIGIYHPGAYSQTTQYTAQLFIGALPYYGEFVLTDIKEDYYEGHFTTGNSVFRSIVKDVKLTDLDYTEVIAGSESVSFTDALNAAARSSYPTHNYTCFPMLVPKYYGDKEFVHELIMSGWGYWPELESGFRPYAAFDENAIFAPSFYLCFVIRRIFYIYGYSIENNAIADDAELSTLVVANYNTLRALSGTYTQLDLKFEDALPPIGINDFIDALEQMFNLTFFISEKSKTVNIKRNTLIVKSAPVRTNNLLRRELQLEKHDGFVLNYTMEPDDEFSDIKSIEGYVIGLTLENRDDLSAYAAGDYENQLAKITNIDLYYRSEVLDAEAGTWEWNEFTKDYFEYPSGNKGLELPTKANPILTDNSLIRSIDPFEYTPQHALYPRVDISSINSEGIQEFKTFDSLRLLFFRGMVDCGGLITDPSTIRGQYPLATPDVYRPKGLTSPNRYGRIKITAANQALRWDGFYGLYNIHWKDYLYWWQHIKRPAKDSFDMSLREIQGIEFWEKYQAGGHTFIFRSISLEINFAKDTCRVGECEVYLS